MKKIYFTLFFLGLMASHSFAQRTVGESVELRGVSTSLFDESGAREVTDTVSASLADNCDSGAFLFGSNESGWVAGGNNYGDLSKAQFIDTDGSGEVYSFLVLVGAKEGGNNESFVASMHSGNATDGPGASLGTSMSVNYSNLDTVGSFTTFAFNSPIAYTDAGFFANVEVSNGSAIFGIVHTGGDCGNMSAWEQWSDNSWFAMASDDSWGADTDIVLFIFAEVEPSSVTSTSDNLIERGSQKVFPNPVTDQSTLMYSLREASDVKVFVYNIQGALVQSYNQGVMPQGLNTLDLGSSELTQGMYTYSIQTEKGVRNGKFQVIR